MSDEKPVFAVYATRPELDSKQVGFIESTKTRAELDEPEQPSNVVNLNSRRHNPHTTGDCQCIECGHRWVAVAPVGVVRYECPVCRTFKGVSCYVVMPKEFLSCVGCGTYFWIITRAGYMCPRCGEERSFEEIER